MKKTNDKRDLSLCIKLSQIELEKLKRIAGKYTEGNVSLWVRKIAIEQVGYLERVTQIKKYGLLSQRHL